MVQNGLGKCGAQNEHSVEVEEKMISEDEIVYQVHTDEVPSLISRDMIDHPSCLSPVREEGSPNLQVIDLFLVFVSCKIKDNQQFNVLFNSYIKYIFKFYIGPTSELPFYPKILQWAC